MWEELLIFRFDLIPGIFLEGLRNTRKDFSQDNRLPIRNLNIGSPEYQAGVTPTLSTTEFSVNIQNYLSFIIIHAKCPCLFDSDAWETVKSNFIWKKERMNTWVGSAVYPCEHRNEPSCSRKGRFAWPLRWCHLLKEESRYSVAQPRKITYRRRTTLLELSVKLEETICCDVPSIRSVAHCAASRFTHTNPNLTRLSSPLLQILCGRDACLNSLRWLCCLVCLSCRVLL
jgi:hypothetical protein